MSTKTNNLKLTKPAATDIVDISAINGNMDIIDEHLATMEETSTALKNGYESADTAIKKDLQTTAARIDNLIVSSGSDSSSEVIDARVDADGVTYDTLGNAIRTQSKDLRNDLKNKMFSGDDFFFKKNCYIDYLTGGYEQLDAENHTVFSEDSYLKLSSPTLTFSCSTPVYIVLYDINYNPLGNGGFYMASSGTVKALAKDNPNLSANAAYVKFGAYRNDFYANLFYEGAYEEKTITVVSGKDLNNGKYETVAGASAMSEDVYFKINYWDQVCRWTCNVPIYCRFYDQNFKFLGNGGTDQTDNATVQIRKANNSTLSADAVYVKFGTAQSISIRDINVNGTIYIKPKNKNKIFTHHVSTSNAATYGFADCAMSRDSYIRIPDNLETLEFKTKPLNFNAFANWGSLRVYLVFYSDVKRCLGNGGCEASSSGTVKVKAKDNPNLLKDAVYVKFVSEQSFTMNDIELNFDYDKSNISYTYGYDIDNITGDYLPVTTTMMDKDYYYAIDIGADSFSFNIVGQSVTDYTPRYAARGDTAWIMLYDASYNPLGNGGCRATTSGTVKVRAKDNPNLSADAAYVKFGASWDIDTDNIDITNARLYYNNHSDVFDFEIDSDYSNLEIQKINNFSAKPYTWHKYLSALFITDIHGDIKRFNRFVNLANEGRKGIIRKGDDPNNVLFDVALFGGDAVLSNTEPQLEVAQVTAYGIKGTDWFKKSTSALKVPFILTTGNHDQGWTAPLKYQLDRNGIYDTYIKNSAISNDAKTIWGYKDFPSYKVRIISIYNFDTGLIEAIKASGATSMPDGVTNGFGCYYSQSQIDWLISTLNSVPEGYGVVIMSHVTVFPEVNNYKTIEKYTSSVGASKSELSNESYSSQSKRTRDNGGNYIISDIVKAYSKRENINETYVKTGGFSGAKHIPDGSQVHAKGNFANAKGFFMCFLVGHHHCDALVQGTLPGYENQFEIACTQGSIFSWQLYDDLPRVDGDPSQDGMLGLVFDTDNKKIKVTRIGSYLSSQFVDRSHYTINLQNNTVE